MAITRLGKTTTVLTLARIIKTLPQELAVVSKLLILVGMVKVATSGGQSTQGGNQESTGEAGSGGNSGGGQTGYPDFSSMTPAEIAAWWAANNGFGASGGGSTGSGAGDNTSGNTTGSGGDGTTTGGNSGAGGESGSGGGGTVLTTSGGGGDPLLTAVAQVVALDLVVEMEPALAEVQIALAAALMAPIQALEQALAVVRGLMAALTEQRAVDLVEHLAVALMGFLAELVTVQAEAVKVAEAPAV